MPTLKPPADSALIRPTTRLYRIGDVVRHTPFSRQTIHNYTIMGLIREVEWTQGGHRLYDESVFDRLSEILTLKRTKTLSQIREMLRHGATSRTRTRATGSRPKGWQEGSHAARVAK